MIKSTPTNCTSFKGIFLRNTPLKHCNILSMLSSSTVKKLALQEWTLIPRGAGHTKQSLLFRIFLQKDAKKLTSIHVQLCCKHKVPVMGRGLWIFCASVKLQPKQRGSRNSQSWALVTKAMVSHLEVLVH